jgi:Tol biopolymer transport system component/DNA-binding winged helix-turn-helix (wHTH) protein
MALEAAESDSYEFDEFRVDLRSQTLFRGDETVQLTPKVFEMLSFFVEHHGELLPKEELMERLWPDSFVEESNLVQNVAVLRKALGESPKQPKYILTVPGRGYRFIAEVRREVKNGVADGSDDAVEASKATITHRGWQVPLLVAAAVILMLGIGGFLLYRNSNTPPALSVSRTDQITAWTGLDFYPSIAPDGGSVAFCSDRSGSFEVFTRQMVPGAKDIQITGDGIQSCQPAFSPDGSRIAYSSKMQPGIYVVPSAGGVSRRLTDFGTRPAWSPDGSEIAFQSDPLNDLGANVRNAMPPSTLWTVAASGGKARQITQSNEPPGGHGAPSWSPDGKRIVFDVNDWAVSKLWTISLADGSVSPVEAGTEAAIESDPIYAPDGKSIFFVSATGASVQNVPVTSFGKATGEPVRVLEASGMRIRQISIDRSGKRIAYATLSIASNIWQTAVRSGSVKAEPVQLTKNANTRTVLPAFSPDGSRIAYQSFKTGSLSNLWIMNSDGSEQQQLTSRPAFNATWSADGRTIWFINPAEGASSYWSVDPNSGFENRLFNFDEGDIFGARASADGSLVAYNSKRSGIPNIWVVPIDGSEPRQFTFDPEFAGFPAWSPDGKWLAVQIKRGPNTHVAVVPSSGGEIVQLTDGEGQSWVNGWAGDSDTVVFAGQRSGVWNVFSVSRTSREVRQLTHFTRLNTYVRYPALSPSGENVVYEFAETTGNIWMIDLK